MVKSPDKLRIHYQNLAIVSHPFVLPAPSFAVRHFCSGLLSIPVNLLQHFIFSIMKQIIYATNRKKTKTKKKKPPEALRRLSCAILQSYIYTFSGNAILQSLQSRT